MTSLYIIFFEQDECVKFKLKYNKINNNHIEVFIILMAIKNFTYPMTTLYFLFIYNS